ncbi:hypothetical protein GCM10011581_12430 [Saccharopolyspora subtropica]|uniref:HTH cro/C1-type domain-containing protein n=1 Tax=Saccharopolyspora thermophila TaxID=89367 RepID=A0A917JMQ8_9PSEU|nr:hypothetical protein [Saccharopolyspora subtropica]GGI76852.1 hypothetical protein GCM10011581_12430 [Saccharopolyspora subtropica]
MIRVPRIAELRLAKGWSQERLAVEMERQAPLAGVRLSSTRSALRVKLSRWENGRNVPEESSRKLLCWVLDCPEEALGLDDSAAPIDGIDPPPTVPYRGAITPETLRIYVTMLDQYAQLDALVGPLAAVGAVREQLRTLEGMLQQTSGSLRIEVARVGARYAEFAGWLAQDSGDYAAAASWSSKAADLAAEAGDPLLSSYIWMRRSNVATDTGHAAEGLLLAHSAVSEAITSDLRALALRQQANAHAIAGRERDAGIAIDQALDEVVSGSETSGLAPYCGASYLQSEGAAAWVRLGRPDRAIALLTEALQQWPDNQARDRGIGLSRLARAHLLSGDLELACVVGHQALEAVQAAISTRAFAELDLLRKALQPLRRQHEATELSDRIRSILSQ